MTPTAITPHIPRRTPGWIALAVGLFFAAAGGAMLLAAGKLYFKQREFLARAERTTGIIVAFEESVETSSRNNYGRRIFYAPVFTFADREGREHRVTSKVSHGDKPGYPLGEMVPVLYRRDRPDEAEFDTFFAAWGGPTILGGMGVAFFAVGGAITISGLRTVWRSNMPRDPAILSGPQ